MNTVTIRGDPVRRDTLPLRHCSTEACRRKGAVSLLEDQKAESEAEIARMFAPGTAMSRHVHTY